MYQIGFVGAGKMARALISALIDGGIASADKIICSDAIPQQLTHIKDQFGVAVTDDNARIIGDCDIVILAFKPQNFPKAVADLKGLVRPDLIVISILAGVPIERLEQYMPARVVRVMPNVACQVGQMAAGYAVGSNVGQDDLARVQRILNCAGTAIPVPQPQLDAVTGLSGSGPAFVAYLIDAFIQAGIAAGLDEQTARPLALKTFAGTARLLDEWQLEPAKLIEMVSSPGGTTVAGREIMESSDITEIIKKTVLRATERSKELANQDR